MTTLLVSQPFLDSYGAELAAAWPGLDLLVLPVDPEGRLTAADVDRVDIAYFSGDMVPAHARAFFAASQGAPNLRWVHVFNAGVDNPVFQRLLAKGVRLTTSAGSSARPIAQTAIGGMLMLARGFPRWMEDQRRHAWDPVRGDEQPPDLDGQTMVVVGLGGIGLETARLARAIGLQVIGIRRRSAEGGEPVDQLLPPSALRAVLPRTDWLVLSCPLTEETRGLIDGAALALLPATARIINVARGEVVDEDALIAALAAGRLGGAYLDVFREEPLPAGSPLWDMPNVIISPHNSAAGMGNDRRATAMFFQNLRAYAAGATLINEIGGD